ncbi:MAG: sugar phosphate isomerase/epimerase [Anaerolineales bacterium]|nr:sugar phosphate isomerase/epimerase [Anaerolineales bacterium]
MKLGIGTYCYMWAIGFKFGERAAVPAHPMTAFGLLARAHELGIHLVQYGPNLPLPQPETPEMAELLAKGRTWNIEFELATRGLETDHLKQQVALSKMMGSKLVRTLPEIDGKPIAAREIPQYLKAILPTLEKEGVKLGLENGKIPARELAWALDQAPSDQIGIVLDMVNSMAVPEGWKDVTTALAPYTICLHHKEFVVKRIWSMMGFTVEGMPAGQGQLDMPWLLDVLDQAGATYNVILEVWPPEQATLQATIDMEDQWVRESIPYLRQFITA